MGLKFGNLAYIRGIVFFRLSPYEQKAFKGMISDGLPNLVRRFNDQVFRVTPCKRTLRRSRFSASTRTRCSIHFSLFAVFVLNYLIISWAKEKNMALSRKDPKDYENDT